MIERKRNNIPIFTVKTLLMIILNFLNVYILFDI
jgi:hypothetical protein